MSKSTLRINFSSALSISFHFMNNLFSISKYIASFYLPEHRLILFCKTNTYAGDTTIFDFIAFVKFFNYFRFSVVSLAGSAKKTGFKNFRDKK